MARKILLDTHVVIDAGAAGGFEAMPAKVRRILEDPEVDLLLSVVSEAEVAIKTRLGKLDLNRNELALICMNASIISYPLRHKHVERLFELPLHHKDPFDRLIISTALSDDIPVIQQRASWPRDAWRVSKPYPLRRYAHRLDAPPQRRANNQKPHSMKSSGLRLAPLSPLATARRGSNSRRDMQYRRPSQPPNPRSAPFLERELAARRILGVASPMPTLSGRQRKSSQ
jgi:PIN domain nuclease of toxin-antitoxin system